MRWTFLPMILAVFGLTNCSGVRPGHVNIDSGELAPCPSSPNCVSTVATGAKHRIEPISYSGNQEEAMEKLVAVVNSMKRAEIVERKGDYLYVEFTTATWRFVDDVEFYLDDGEKLIHFRSASRVGHSDLGVNRKRMEKIRLKFRND